LNKSIDLEDGGSTSMVKETRENHVHEALRCFIRAVSCEPKNQGFFLEDCLKILNLLFNESEVSGLVEELHKSYTEIPTDRLIDIIPQIIGRLHSEKPKLLDMMRKLLIYIGENHPQLLVFYLVFLRRGKNLARQEIAVGLCKEISNKASQLIPLYEDTEKIVAELCKVSVKLSEKFQILMHKLHE
jgi:phosphatidylinositol kinase/protein kinase (PI-3  family)